MSERARAFLTNWLSEHTHPLPVTRRMAEAVRLATACRKDATAAGIPLQEIRDLSDGDVILKMLGALDAAAQLAEDVGIAPEIEATVEDRPVDATVLPTRDAWRKAFAPLNRH
jgi:hypothetical protein